MDNHTIQLPEESVVDETPSLPDRQAVVELDPHEVWLAGVLSDNMVRNSRRLGLRDAHGLEATEIEGEKLTLQGTLAEMAAAKYFGVYWTCHPGTFREPDVSGVQVRSTDKRANKLIVRQGSNPDHPYLLVITKHHPKYIIAGWVLAKDAMKSRYLFNPGHRGAAYFVSQHYLSPPWEIPEQYLKQQNELRRIPIAAVAKR